MARRGDRSGDRDRADAGHRQAPLRHARRSHRAAAAGARRRASSSTRCWCGRRACRSTTTGNATVEIPLNDSLTSFRIVAVASSGAGLFGTGQASIRSTQDLMLLSGLPPLVREGDRFRATFTVRNASQRPLDIAVTAKPSATGATLAPLAPQGVALAARAGARALAGRSRSRRRQRRSRGRSTPSSARRRRAPLPPPTRSRSRRRWCRPSPSARTRRRSCS